MLRKAVFTASLTLLFPFILKSQGFIIPDRGHQIVLQNFEVSAEIQENLGKFYAEHEFYNPGKSAVQGVFYFPLPVDAQVTSFALEADGKVLEGELLDAGEARKIYTDIVRKALDPALLEMMHDRTFRASIFPIPPHKSRKITLEYAAILPNEQDLVKLQIPLRGRLKVEGAVPRRIGPPFVIPETREQSGGQPQGRVTTSIAVSISAQSSLSNIYSPTHDVEITRKRGNAAEIHFEQSGRLSGKDFILYYTLDQSEISMRALAYRPGAKQDGYFALLVAPRYDRTLSRIERKDIIWLVDVSGSMKGKKIEQARNALRYWIENLNPGDRFNLVAFSSGTHPFSQEWAVSGDDRKAALQFIDDLQARGGTNINAALQLGQQLAQESPRALIVFLTDGLPSVGVRDEGEILKNVKKAARVRIFSFGLGYDVNAKLLDGLARATNAFSDYISPDENLEEQLGQFADKIRYPVLSDVRIDFNGAKVDEIYPQQLPDLFMGQQLILFGRYTSAGRYEIRLIGRAKGKEQRFSHRVELPSSSGRNDFIAPLWAARKIGFLLDEIQLNGETKELREEVIALSKEYGIVTPYTSYLAEENVEPTEGITLVPAAPGRPVPQGVSDHFLSADLMSGESASAAMKKSSGRAAVVLSESKNELMQAGTLSGLQAGDKRVRVVGGREMTRSDDGYWKDRAYQSEPIDLHIKFAGAAYFDLLELQPALEPFFALGEKLIIQYRGKWIKVDSEGAEKIERTHLKSLFE